MSDSHARVEAAIKAFAKGDLVVVTDDDDRENEGDLFVAATLGALLARDRRLQLRGAAIAAVVCVGFDLLFFVVSETPSTVPIALTLAVLELSGRRPIRAA